MRVLIFCLFVFFVSNNLRSQSLTSNVQHISTGEVVVFDWTKIGSGTVLDFGDGSVPLSLKTAKGSVTHKFSLPGVYYVRISNSATKLVISSKSIQVSNCQLEIYDVGTNGNFELNYCDLISNGECVTPDQSINSYEYWTTQSLIRCFPMSADSCILEMRCKLTRLPSHYLCLDLGLFIFGSNDLGLVHFFDNAGCISFYSFGVGSDKEQSSSNIIEMKKELDGKWVTVQLKKEGTRMSSYFDGTLVATYDTNVSLGELWGIRFVAKGKTQFDYIKLSNSKGEIFIEEKYNSCTQLVTNQVKPFSFSIKIDSAKTSTSCQDSTNFVALSVDGPSACYKYILDGSVTQNVGLFTNLPGGKHTIKVGDISNCQFQEYSFFMDASDEPTHQTVLLTICPGDTIFHNGKIYLQVGTYLDTIRNQAKCDSIVNKINVVTANSGCDSSLCQVKIPNIFTPNDDQLNDFFQPITEISTPIEVSIYDRWGNIVFYERSIQPKWNGQKDGIDLLSDVFTYVIIGSCNSGRRFSKKGEVFLLR